MGDISELGKHVDKAERLGFDGYCTDCENLTRLHDDSRCGCGSGRVVTPRSLPALKGKAQGGME